MPENKTAFVGVRLPVDLRDWLYLYADRLGIPVSQLVRQIIREYRELIAE